MFWVGNVSLVLFFLEGYILSEALEKVPRLNSSENLGKNPLSSSLSHGWRSRQLQLRQVLKTCFALQEVIKDLILNKNLGQSSNL